MGQTFVFDGYLSNQTTFVLFVFDGYLDFGGVVPPVDDGSGGSNASRHIYNYHLEQERIARRRKLQYEMEILAIIHASVKVL